MPNPRDMIVSFVLPDHYPTRNGPISGFYFSDGVCEVPKLIAPQAESLLVRYYGCTRHEGSYKPKKAIKETKRASKKAVSGVKSESVTRNLT